MNSCTSSENCSFKAGLAATIVGFWVSSTIPLVLNVKQYSSPLFKIFPVASCAKFSDKHTYYFDFGNVVLEFVHDKIVFTKSNWNKCVEVCDWNVSDETVLEMCLFKLYMQCVSYETVLECQCWKCIWNVSVVDITLEMWVLKWVFKISYLSSKAKY